VADVLVERVVPAEPALDGDELALGIASVQSMRKNQVSLAYRNSRRVRPRRPDCR
jgi:hypothetical protein